MNATIKCLNLSAKVLLIVMLAVTCVAQTQQTPNQPGPSPQVKQTVEAVTGYWVGYMTTSLPGIKPEQFPWEMTCKVVALGSGAACSMKGTASIGPIEEACRASIRSRGQGSSFHVRHLYARGPRSQGPMVRRPRDTVRTVQDIVGGSTSHRRSDLHLPQPRPH